jgi:hypothetical protein
MRPNRALEAVKQEQDWCAGGSIQMVNVQKITVRRLQPLDSCIVYLLTPEKFSPQRLCMTAR